MICVIYYLMLFECLRLMNLIKDKLPLYKTELELVMFHLFGTV
jgi:hypothetical protein